MLQSTSLRWQLHDVSSVIGSGDLWLVERCNEAVWPRISWKLLGPNQSRPEPFHRDGEQVQNKFWGWFGTVPCLDPWDLRKICVSMIEQESFAIGILCPILSRHGLVHRGAWDNWNRLCSKTPSCILIPCPEELHASVAAAGGCWPDVTLMWPEYCVKAGVVGVHAAGRRRSLPPVVDQLQVFVEQRRVCEVSYLSYLLSVPLVSVSDSCNRTGTSQLERCVKLSKDQMCLWFDLIHMFCSDPCESYMSLYNNSLDRKDALHDFVPGQPLKLETHDD